MSLQKGCEMKLIITGATGFIGMNISERLQALGHTLITTGRDSARGKELSTKGIDFRSADISRPREVADIIEESDVLIHCAAKAGDWGDYQDFFQTNVAGTKNVIQGCIKNKIGKVIFISTPSIYYNGKDREGIKESEPLPVKQKEYYSKTKLLAEEMFFAPELKEIDTIILRPRAVYGIYDRIIIPRILKLAAAKNFPLINGGKALVDVTYVGNLVAAVELCLNAEADRWNEIYNISNGCPVRIKDWFAAACGVFGKPFKPKSVPLPLARISAAAMELAARLPWGNKRPAMTSFSVGYMARSMTLSIEKAREKLGYEPGPDQLKGFQDYKEWVKNKQNQALLI